MYKNLKIGFDPTFLDRNGGGISHDSTRIFSKLNSFSEIEKIQLQKSNFDFVQVKINRICRRNYKAVKNYDVLFFSQFHNYRLNNQQLQVIRVHDLFPITNPEWFRLISRISFKFALKNNLKQNSFYLCNSKRTADEFLKHFPSVARERVYIEECEVDYLKKIPCSSCLICNNGYFEKLLKQKFIVAIGTLEPRKNYQFLIESWKKYQAGRDSKFLLVIIGRYGWKASRVLRALNGSDANMIWFNGICDYGVKRVLEGAQAYVCTSYDEGFGMPALEAATLATPLILPRITAFQEKYKNVYFYRQNDFQEILNIFAKVETKDVLRPNIQETLSELNLLISKLEVSNDLS